MARASFVRNTLPIIVGFFLGSMLCLFLFPTIEEIEKECSKNIDPPVHSFSSEAAAHSNFHNGTETPMGKTKSVGTSPAKTGSKINRPRFCATELGIKDKLFVGVVTSREKLPTLAAAINKTVAHHVSKLVFFIESPIGFSPEASNSPPRFLNLVNIAAGTPDNLKPFAILNHMAGRGRALANNYDWFFFMPDSVYLKAFKLFELVSHISFGYDVQIGRPWGMNNSQVSTNSFCDFNAGVLISFGLMRSILDNLRQCTKTIDSTLTASENLGRCVLSANSEAVCSEEWNNKLYRSWPLQSPALISTDLAELGKHDSFNSALTVYPVESANDIFLLHNYYCNQEIDQINQLIATVEQGLLTSALSANDSDEISWPPGDSLPSRQRTRYDVLKWDYFTATDMFESSNDLNMRPLSGVNKKDVDETVTFAVNALVEKYPTMKFRRLLSGYRRFDPKRGMDYIIDLLFESEVEIRKRVRLIRPLNRVELVPAPYVTEATPVVVVVPLGPDDASAGIGFLHHFSRTCLDANANARLIFILFYETPLEQDAYKSLTSKIEMVRKKYSFGDQKSTQSGVEYAHMRASAPSPFLLMDLMVQTVGRDHLYLVVTPWTEIYGDFLNRVRMNTIKEYQVFIPVPFVQFNPKISRHRKPGALGVNQEHIDVHKNVGHFDWHDFSTISFYGSDYYLRRQTFAMDSERLYFELDLASLFVNTTLHVFRAVEPALKIRYYQKECNKDIANDLYAKCTLSRKERLGTKAQLANLLLEYDAISDGV